MMWGHGVDFVKVYQTNWIAFRWKWGEGYEGWHFNHWLHLEKTKI